MKLEFTKNNGVNEVYWLTHIENVKDDYRQHVRTVLIKDGFAYKTDGKRMTRLKIDEHVESPEDGVYEVLKRIKSRVILMKLDEETRWPEVEDLFNVDFENCHGSFKASNQLLDYGVANVFRKLPQDRTFNLHWFLDMVDSEDFTVCIQDEEANKPFLFHDENKTGLLMPVNV
jgi:hypothetical protein